MKKRSDYRDFYNYWRSLIMRFLGFLALTSIVVTCCLFLFLHSIKLDIKIIKVHAQLTFINVVFISFLFTLIHSIRRKLTVERPIRRIRTAMQKIMKGDFSVRIQPLYGVTSTNDFDAIIREINSMTKELASVETLRTDFIANVSHELKTPLAVLQNYGTMLQQPNLPESKRLEYAKAITDASRRLANLITNILKLNRLENQQIFPQTKLYNLSEQLCECLLTFETDWDKKDLEIQTNIDDEIFIKADSELLSLVWNNLFSNAIKFTEPKGTVSVSLKKDGSQNVVVAISDTGCGMSPETVKHIFEKFYQGDTSHSTQGNGLGLALVKRVMDITGGKILVESAPNKGSTFIVRLIKNALNEGDFRACEVI